jgi:adenosylmethionine-8-amino-7-oxononanoate aminotransferase
MVEERNLRLELEDKRYIWHPFTQMNEYLDGKPLIIEHGEGCYLKDIEGNRYLDGVSSLWVNIHGHRRREIDEAIIEQIHKISHSTLLGLSNIPAIELAKKLVEITPPGLDKVFYSDTGAAAVEIALKIAFQYWQQKSPEFSRKTKFICLKNGYHGDTLGAVSVGGIDVYHQIYKPLLFPAIKAESPYCYRCSFNQSWPDCDYPCLDQLEGIMKRDHQEVAALIIEPMVQAVGGMIVFPPGYLKKVRELCTKYNILMIADEVAVGWGRTGRMFACEHEGVEPDLMALGKGITGGYLPLACTLTTQEIFDAFLGEYEEQKTFYHGHTYTGNPLACAAALANIEIFERDKTLEGLQEKIAVLKQRLESFNDLPHVGEVRQLGFTVGIELVRDKKSKESYHIEERVGHRVIMEARYQGLIIRPLGDIIVIMPPLSINIEDLERVVSIVYRSIREVTEGGR